jgi:hypothetical protein
MRTSQITIVLCLALAGAAAAQTRSALETDASGWADLMPDESLKGWTRIGIPPAPPQDPKLQWKVDPAAKTLICEGDGAHEWLRYDRELANYILHVEWRYEPREGNPRYNSGIGVRMTRFGDIWHQAQTGQTGAYWFGATLIDGVVGRVNLSKEMKENRVKPAGEWNVFEIRADGPVLSLWTNGAVVSEFKECQLKKGYIGLEAEGFKVHFRNLKVKELP